MLHDCSMLNVRWFLTPSSHYNILSYIDIHRHSQHTRGNTSKNKSIKFAQPHMFTP